MNETAVMTDHVPVRRLFETHLTVSDLQRSIGFYQDVVGLKLAFEASERNAAFFWIGDSGRSMLGLWSLGTVPLNLHLHLAFRFVKQNIPNGRILRILKAKEDHGGHANTIIS